ncbi:hypothetical protein KPL71_012000 [Citrus sinensis]|uniref:Uncharacterized protein n=1 Tax=Citrus sinensis TaxID=2711 RepID=A0ACB8L7Q7_CITSI|nr:hypothetical protein KPL71_012000 [Citrus sinensis]
MTFRPPPTAPEEPPWLSFTYSAMVTDVQIAQEKLPITGFNLKGYPVYLAKLNGHFLWDSPGSGNCDLDCPCWDDWDEDDYEPKRRRKPKKKLPKTPCSHHQHKPPHNSPPPPAPLPIYQKELSWIAKNCKTDILSNIQHSTPPIQPMACMMFSSTSRDYSSNFPALETHTDPQRKVITKLFIPSAITLTGHLEDPKPFEVNHISLRTDHLESKMDSITSQMQQIYQNLQSRISQLDSELRTMLSHRYFGLEFDQKEKEIRKLKAELEQIELERQRPTLFTTSPTLPPLSPAFHPFAPMLSPIKPQDPSKLFGMTHTLFRNNPLPKPSRSKPHPRPRPEKQLFQPPLSISKQHQPLYPPIPPQPTPTQTKDKSPMQQYSAQIIPDPSDIDQTSDSNLAISADSSESDTESSLESSISSSDSEKSYADITRILMAQPDETEPAQSSRIDPFFDIPSDIEEDPPEATLAPTRPAQNDHKPANGPWFTFDDIPAAKWRDRLSEMAAWTDLQMLRANATTVSVLRELATRFTGSLRDWFDTLGEYRQLQFVQLPNVSSALSVIHEQFIGESAAVFEAARRDYLNMKCCSLNSKDLDFHYKRMSILFYKLNGFNDPTLKHVFLASLTEELQPDIQRQLTSLNLTIDNISLGKIFQIAKGCLEKLCEQKQFFKELLKDKEPFRNEIEFYFLEQEEPTDETVFALQNSSDDFENDEFQTVFHQQLLSLDTTIPIPSIKLHILPSKFQRPISTIGLLDARAQRSTQDDHRHLLNQFLDIIQSHGIMLSAKKSTIATNNIEFLGMTIKDGHYQPGKHIAQELIHFPDQNLSKKQIQQFLEAKMFTFVFIIHRPYFQHPDTHFFWTQDQVFEWFTTPHPSILEQDDKVQKELYNFLCELNQQPAPHKDISHTSLGPQHDIIMIPTPSAISKPKSTGIIIKEEKPDFTDFLYQDAQDTWEAFLPLSQHLQNLQQTPPSHASDDPMTKASSSKPSECNDHPSSDWCKIFCPWPPCRPDHQYPPKTPRPSLKVLFSRDKDATDSSSDEDYMNLSSL